MEMDIAVYTKWVYPIWLGMTRMSDPCRSEAKHRTSNCICFFVFSTFQSPRNSIREKGVNQLNVGAESVNPTTY
ncbi:uncharacterized protein N7487_000439 [Penicillium crustosum]|uniref:uncharacterized protein n=1 Tax=Penicillium crustosum TaxID=36656 RepID=UPI00239194F6|nr:uncharacterized protein N7487_000439 [Penicillium crustosum]KAJ5416889.1 hypothetical protein N7487_000439 [Penicillium crustosum]